MCLFDHRLFGVFTDRFQVLSKFHLSAYISVVKANEVIPDLPTIVTCGPGNVTIWNFR